MRKTLSFIVILFIFSLVHLHQKINIYIEAYRLTANYSQHSDLLAQRDSLMCVFSKEVSLVKINQWAQGQKFSTLNRERVVALEIKKAGIVSNPASFFDRILNVSISASSAEASEKY